MAETITSAYEIFLPDEHTFEYKVLHDFYGPGVLNDELTDEQRKSIFRPETKLKFESLELKSLYSILISTPESLTSAFDCTDQIHQIISDYINILTKQVLFLMHFKFEKFFNPNFKPNYEISSSEYNKDLCNIDYVKVRIHRYEYYKYAVEKLFLENYLVYINKKWHKNDKCSYTDFYLWNTKNRQLLYLGSVEYEYRFDEELSGSGVEIRHEPINKLIDLQPESQLVSIHDYKFF
jgi:hypothetical protein